MFAHVGVNILSSLFVCVCFSCDLTLSVLLLHLHLHMWEPEVKVTETKQAAFLLVTSTAAVAFCPGRLDPGPGPASNLLHSVI